MLVLKTSEPMRLLFSLALIGLCYNLTAQSVISYPYNPDSDDDQYISVNDVLSTISAFGQPFTPAEIMIDGVGLYTVINDLQTIVAAQQAYIVELQQYISISNETVLISGANLQVVSGEGSTPSPVNGTGNIIIGYNEDDGDDKTGSHNLIVGKYNSYSGYGGIVVGYDNATTGSYCSVLGGAQNSASGIQSTVSGGTNNTASGEYSSVSGGSNSTADGNMSSVSGGILNTASGNYSSVLGGSSNQAIGFGSSIVCGQYNTVTNYYGSILGGYTNTASGIASSISGGLYNDVSGNQSSIVGGINSVLSPAFGFLFLSKFSFCKDSGINLFKWMSLMVWGKIPDEIPYFFW